MFQIAKNRGTLTPTSTARHMLMRSNSFLHRRKARMTWKKVTVSEDVEVIEIVSSNESGDES